MTKRLTLELIKEKLSIINPNIKILSDKYIDANAHLLCKCLIDGYEWKSKWRYLQQGKGCPICNGKTNKLTIEEVKRKLLIMNPNVEILSEEYVNYITPLKCRCKVCGYTWQREWNILSKSNNCQNCSKGSKKFTLEDVKQEFINRGYIPLFNKYNRNNEKLVAMTKDGYKIVTRVSALKQNRIPQVFNPCNPYTIDNIKLWIKLNNKPYELVSTEYKERYNKLILLCPTHGNFRMTWDTLIHGGGCPTCLSKRRRGENNPLWNPNKSQEEREIERHYPEYYDFIRNTMKRDDYTCDITGVRGGRLVVHHLNGYNWFIEGRTDINNAVTLCEKEHKLFHKIYGNGDNTLQQYIMFKENRLKELHNTENNKAS